MQENAEESTGTDQWPAEPMLVGAHRAALLEREQPTKPAKRPALPTVSRRAEPTSRPLPNLTALILLGLLTAFFSWVTAEPLWMAVGHSTTGTATVTHCSGQGILRACKASFTAHDESFTAAGVQLVGANSGHLADGTRMPARMVSSSGRLAYAGSQDGLVLRWAVGLGLVALGGFGIALATRANRLPAGRQRRYAVAGSVVGPFLLLVGMMIATR
jgi:hypothetical protein